MSKYPNGVGVCLFIWFALGAAAASSCEGTSCFHCPHNMPVFPPQQQADDDLTRILAVAVDI